MMLEFGFWSEVQVAELRNKGFADYLFEFSKSNVKIERVNLDLLEYFRQIPGGFLLHSSNEERPATVIFHAIPLDGHWQFQARITSENIRAHSPIRFDVKLAVADSGHVIGSTHAVLEAGATSDIEVAVPDWARTLVIDVTFSTERADVSRNNYYCWAHWYVPRMTFG
jgi:hypothetical protein